MATLDIERAWALSRDSQVDQRKLRRPEVHGLDGLEFLRVSPDPTSGPVAIHLRLNTVKMVGFKLVDNTGRTALSLAPAPMYGDQTLEADLSHVSCGTYYLQVTFDGQPQVIKILVVR